MRRGLKISIIVIVGSLLVALVFWYATSFLPHLSELKSISSRGNASIGNIEHVFYPLAVAGETTEGLRSYAVRQAYRSLVFEHSPGGTFSWHANNILWLGASYFHFNKHEIFGLWVECALSGCDSGLKSVARQYFGKEIIDLSERELAGLVAIVKGPTRYAPGTELGEKRTNEILAR